MHVSAADEMSTIRQIEKGRHYTVDNLLNIFMKGCAAEIREKTPHHGLHEHLR